ncbi:MAG: flagellar motor switch protein FliN [Pseudomonadota bacterium]
MSETEEPAEEGQQTAPPPGDEEKFSPDELEGTDTDSAPANDVNLDLILDVSVTMALHVGSTEISIRDLVSLAEGSVVALDREASEPLDVMVNGTLIARGEIVVVDGQFGVRLTDVVSPAARIETLS